MNREPRMSLQGRLNLVSSLLGIAALVLSSACSSSSGTPGGTDGGGTDTGTKKDSGGKVDSGTDSAGPASACGHPGDKGNSKGVGKYCTASTGQCPATAPICSVIENSMMPKSEQTYFCVLPGCSACSPPGFCGEGASCQCNTLGCGCTPDTCSSLFPEGGVGTCDGGADAGGGG